MAWNQKQLGTKHNDICTMAFGNLSAIGCCPRCDELRNGAKARQGWNDAKIKADLRHSEAIKRHFANGGKHDQIVKQGGVDTAFEW